MISYYPQFSHLMNEFSYIGGNSCGIITGEFLPVSDYSSTVSLKMITGNMPFYHKLVLNNSLLNIQYHISGYGMFYEESFIKFIGESIERYSTIIAPKLLSGEIVYDSYKNMKKRGITMPLRYMDVFTDEQRERISKLIPWISSEEPKENDVIGWLPCHSLTIPGKVVWIPAQMLFVGYINKNEKLFVPSFSTGTAAHTTLKNALLNAILEYIHIDTFIIKWYTKLPSPKLKIDDKNVISVLKHMKIYESKIYDTIPLYLTLPDVPVPVFGVFLKNKNKDLPHIVFGVQGDVDTANGIIRATMEAASIISPTKYNSLINPDVFYSATKDSSYIDLDTNVFYFANPNHIEEKEDIIKDLINGKMNLSSISNYASLNNKVLQLTPKPKFIANYLQKHIVIHHSHILNKVS